MKVILNLEGSCFKTGYEILNRNDTMLVGMSPGNSYFKKDTISQLLSTVSRLCKNVTIFIPDVPAKHTYNAIGYPITRAEAIARKKGNNLRNHIRRAKDDNNITNITIIDWRKDIERSSAYHKYKKYIYDLYRKNEVFYHDARQTTKLVIADQIKKNIDLENAVDIAINYFLEELAFILASPGICGFEKIAYTYHKRWPIFENLISGHYDRLMPNIGFVIIAKEHDNLV